MVNTAELADFLNSEGSEWTRTDDVESAILANLLLKCRTELGLVMFGCKHDTWSKQPAIEFCLFLFFKKEMKRVHEHNVRRLRCTHDTKLVKLSDEWLVPTMDTSLGLNRKTQAPPKRSKPRPPDLLPTQGQRPMAPQSNKAPFSHWPSVGRSFIEQFNAHFNEK